MRIAAIVQARMGSTRLPGKVLMDLAGEPMLERCLSRVARAQYLDNVIVATSGLEADDTIRHFCSRRGWDCFSGNENDVLDRYYQAARAYAVDIVARITSDCPLIEPEIVDWVIRDFVAGFPLMDYASNTIGQRTFPRGLDVEVFSFAALERAWTEDENPAWREHVTPYMYRYPRRFNLQQISNSADCSALRWTVDTAQDLEFARRVYSEMGNDTFGWRDVLALLERKPELSRINGDVRQKTVV
ncbi:MAG TPA: glycosyltransferase family protein [Blastocatellia bacterium]